MRGVPVALGDPDRIVRDLSGHFRFPFFGLPFCSTETEDRLAVVMVASRVPFWFPENPTCVGCSYTIASYYASRTSWSRIVGDPSV